MSCWAHTVCMLLGEMTSAIGKGWKRALNTGNAKLESTDLPPRAVSGLSPQVQAVSCWFCPLTLQHVSSMAQLVLKDGCLSTAMSKRNTVLLVQARAPLACFPLGCFMLCLQVWMRGWWVQAAFPHHTLIMVSGFGEEQAGKPGALGMGWCMHQQGWEGVGGLPGSYRQNR